MSPIVRTAERARRSRRRLALVWDELPAWYNLIVPLVIAGSIAAGSRV